MLICWALHRCSTSFGRISSKMNEHIEKFLALNGIFFCKKKSSEMRKWGMHAMMIKNTTCIQFSYLPINWCAFIFYVKSGLYGTKILIAFSWKIVLLNSWTYRSNKNYFRGVSNHVYYSVGDFKLEMRCKREYL